MAVFRIETTFDAPLEDVWDLHTTGSGLAQLTPAPFALRIEDVRGGTATDPLPVDAEIDVSADFPGPGSRDRWTGVVTASRLDEAHGLFRDEMRDGTFPTWVHTHRFESVPEGTRMVDRIEYRLPSPVGPASPLAKLGLWPLFRYRHRRAQGILES